MNLFSALVTALAETGSAEADVYGHSMYPHIKHGGHVIYKKAERYETGDIVFGKFKGMFFAALYIKAIDPLKGYQVSNSTGWDTGWTKEIFGRVVEAYYNGVMTYRR